MTDPPIQIKLSIFAFHAGISVEEAVFVNPKNNGFERAVEKGFCFWNVGRFHLPAFYQCNVRLIRLAVELGQKVLMPEFGGTEVTIGGEKLQLYRDQDFLGVLES